MSRTIKRKARHRYVYTVHFFGDNMFLHSSKKAFLSKEDAREFGSEFIQTLKKTAKFDELTYEIIELSLQSEKLRHEKK